MYQNGGTTVVRKRMSFLSVLVISLTAIIVTVVLSAFGIAVYGLRIADVKATDLVGLVGETAKSLPELCKSLPPALADAIHDQRRPDYRAKLDVSARLTSGESGRPGLGIIVEVTNRGDEVVSLLTMRLVGLDDEGDPVFERNTWVATPLQIEQDWRGPLLPHETRRIPLRVHASQPTRKVATEITDIRVWQGTPEPADAKQADPK